MRATIRTLTIALVAIAPSPAAEPEKMAVDLAGDIDGRGLALAESDKPVYRVHLTARVDKNGEGTGTLVLDVTPRKVDEFGIPESAPVAVVKLECSLKLVKKKKVVLGPAGPPPVEVECRLFEIAGPKITSRLSLAIEGGSWTSARFLASDKEGKGRIAVIVRDRERPFPPCHPGCFPAGTLIRAPGGERAVESLRAGDVVTTVDPDGTPGQGKVTSVFVTNNRLIEVRTEAGTLATTETQPLALASGWLRAAGELKAGDRIYSWDGRERRVVAVRAVVATAREAQVFNVVLGDPVLFVAGGFLARSKPPAPAAPAPADGPAPDASRAPARN
jgi:hypothetical protein